MNLRYKKIIVFVLAAIVYAAGFFFSNPEKFGFCSGLQANSYICRVPGAVNIGWPLIALGQMLAIIAVILLFSDMATFRRWLKFSAFYVPATLILDYLIYPISFAPAPLSHPASYAQGVYPFGWLYVLVTLGIVLWGFFSARRTIRQN